MTINPSTNRTEPMTIQGKGARKGYTGTVIFSMGKGMTRKIRWDKIAVDAEIVTEEKKLLTTSNR